jgi:hypothetical protein
LVELKEAAKSLAAFHPLLPGFEPSTSSVNK